MRLDFNSVVLLCFVLTCGYIYCYDAHCLVSLFQQMASADEAVFEGQIYDYSSIVASIYVVCVLHLLEHRRAMKLILKHITYSANNRQ